MPNCSTERLISANPALQASFLLQYQVRHHSSENVATPGVEMRRVILIQVVRLRRFLANSIHVRETGGIEVDPRRVAVFSR
jgi:hypothetical protein